MLTAENVVCGYDGRPVVNGVSFHLEAGQRLAVLGPNGCGKTTLMRALAGLLPFSGEIRCAGLDMHTAPRKTAARSVALMSQMSGADFGYSVYDTVMMGRYAHQKGGLFGGATAQDKAVVEDALQKTGIAELKDRQVTELSGGQLQRVFLARVFAQQPSVILLDEPTNHLDLKFQVELVQLLRQWAAQGERCIVGVLHDINLALEFADMLLLMDGGRAVYEGRAQDFDMELLQTVYGMDVRSWMQRCLKRWE